MARGRSGLLVGAITLAMAGAWPARSAPQQSVEASGIDLATYYLLGEHEEVAGALRRASSGDLGVVLSSLRTEAPRWIDADGPSAAGRRRLAVAAVALEAAFAGLDTQWTRAAALLEWGCETLRAGPAPIAGEEEWYLAALAVIEGARDVTLLERHLEHHARRVPEEPRLRLARAFIAESAFWDAKLLRAIDLAPNRPVEALADALSHPGTRAEARLRLGYFALEAGRFDEALAHLQAVGPGDDDGQRYLAHLFAGWAHERRGGDEAATATYRAAMLAAPGARAAMLALATRRYAAGDEAEGRRLVSAALDPANTTDDPWQIYGYGDLRRWPLLVGALRRSFQ